MISWPSQVQINKSDVTCIILDTFSDKCSIQDEKKNIMITNAFLDAPLSGYVSQVTIKLGGVVNPVDNKEKGSAFTIQTYANEEGDINIDQLVQSASTLFPKLKCVYPCRDCAASDDNYCQSCWTSQPNEFKYLFEEDGKCLRSCPSGYTRDNEDTYLCIPCDSSCSTCKDEDKTDCITCAPLFPKKLSGTSNCLVDCTRGYFQTANEEICATCEAPCADCEGDQKFCTACDADSEFPELFQNRCIAGCDDGYTSVNGECQKCNAPCGNCEGTVDSCLSCDGSEDRRYLYANTCYSECPANSSPDSTNPQNLVCIGCSQESCVLCDAESPDVCKLCVDGLYTHDGQCVSACPSGWKTNNDGTACVEFTINDIGIIPFPFLIAAFIGCMIASFGLCKKKLVRNKYKSTQHTITCFIIILAFIQFLAMIAMIIWAFLFELKFLMFGALGLIGLLIILNVTFQIFYTFTFNRMITPSDKQKKYKEGKISKAELKKYIFPSDLKFSQYAKKHGCVSWTIAIFTFFCSFKCNKLYYSHFYSFNMFKAQWSMGGDFQDGKYYRKSMTIFCIVAMVLDSLIICLCIASITSLEVMSNNLWVTTVEVAVLSLLLVIFGCIELCSLKKILHYNEKKKSGFKRQNYDVSSANDFLDKDSREVMMKNLLRNVKTNQDMFLNNKLDDLLNMFGDRRCKSMIEFGTGWEKEDDPRQNITWPLSPAKISEYDGEYKFTKEDMIGGFEDNVYAEAKVPEKRHDMAVQGDQGQQDFVRQLHRKQGDLLAGQIDEDDELMNRKAKGKRRGRKNKYYTAIDAEDDEEADGQEPSVAEEDDEQEDNLAIIKEQEEEEEQLRLKVEEERKKQELAQVERRAKLAEAERLRTEAEAVEEQARRQAVDEEDKLRQAQEDDEMERMRDLQATRARLAKEEEEAKLKAEADEEARRKDLANMNEANRARYEAEDAERKKALEEERERLNREREENEAKVQAELAELNKRKIEEQTRLQAQRDADELRLRNEQQERDDRLRQDEKEAERIRLEQEDADRRRLAASTAEEKRIAQMEQDRLKREADDLDRQRRQHQDEIARQEAFNLEEEKRQKRNAEEDARRRKQDDDDRAQREKLDKEDADRKARQDQEDADRLERMNNEEDRAKARMEQEAADRKAKLDLELASRKKALNEEEAARLKSLNKNEADTLERIRLEEEARLKAFQEAESERVQALELVTANRLKALDDEEQSRTKAMNAQESDRKAALDKEAADRLKALEAEGAAKLLALNNEEAQRRTLLKDESEARLKRIEEEVEARKLQDEEDRKRKKSEDDKRAQDEEKRILKEQQLIDDEKAKLAALKAKQEAELAEIARQEEQRKLQEARDTEERLERERIEREAMEKEKAELARKQKDAEQRLLAEKDDMERARLLKEAEELENQEKLRKEREAFEEEKRNKLAAEESARHEAEAKRLEDEARRVENGTQMSAQAIQEKKLEEEDEALEAEIVMSQELIQDFNKPSHPVEMPPNADNRTFNVNDILGELDRDDRGNIIVLQDSQGNNCDKTGLKTNIRGYLENSQGDIIENHTKQKIFGAEEMDDKGELPAPFCVEKFNFNPHNLMGDIEFQYDPSTGRAIPQLLMTNQKFYVDKKGRRINRFGWLVQGGNGHVVDKIGRKKFDRKLLDDGDVPKLLNYTGKRFDVKDVIGVFDKDANGNIILQRGQGGSYNDNMGREVNEKGYLIDIDGNIIDREGKRIFVKEHLKNGEFPKIFLFTKFNVDNITGDFELSPLSEPILDQDNNGNFIDRKGRLVNSRGYLIDRDGNIIDKRGKRMFDKIVLTAEGEIPKIFRMQILKTDSGSSLSRLMDEIEKNQPSEYERVEEEKDEGNDGDTSVDSAMGDTPANYNMANQRFDEGDDIDPIIEEPEHKQRKRQPRNEQLQADVHFDTEMPRKKTKKRTKKKKKGYLEYLMPTGKEVNMADAYGGMAKGQFRRKGVKYDKERLMNRIKTPANIPGGRAQLEALAATVAGFHKGNAAKHYDDDNKSQRGPSSRPPRVKRNQFMGDSHDGGNSVMNTSQISQGPKGVRNQTSKGRDSRTNLNDLRQRKMNTQQRKGDANDFEKMFGKDVDQYLEGSEFDLDEYDRLSQFSRGTGRNSQANMKLKAMEQVYLQRIESNQAQEVPGKQRKAGGVPLGGQGKKQSPKNPPAFREFQDRFVDQPDYVHRGQQLEFETDQLQDASAPKKKPYAQSPLRQGPAGQAATKFEKQTRQRQ